MCDLLLFAFYLFLLLVQLQAQELEFSEEAYEMEVESAHVPPRTFEDHHPAVEEKDVEITTQELDSLASLLHEQYQRRNNGVEQEPTEEGFEEEEAEEREIEVEEVIEEEEEEEEEHEEKEIDDVNSYADTMSGTEMERLIASNAGPWDLFKAQIKQDFSPVMIIADKLGVTNQIMGILKSLKGIFIGVGGPLTIVGLRMIEKAFLAVANVARAAGDALELSNESEAGIEIEIETTTSSSLRRSSSTSSNEAEVDELLGDHYD